MEHGSKLEISKAHTHSKFELKLYGGTDTKNTKN